MICDYLHLIMVPFSHCDSTRLTNILLLVLVIRRFVAMTHRTKYYDLIFNETCFVEVYNCSHVFSYIQVSRLSTNTPDAVYAMFRHTQDIRIQCKSITFICLSYIFVDINYSSCSYPDWVQFRHHISYSCRCYFCHLCDHCQ